MSNACRHLITPDNQNGYDPESDDSTSSTAESIQLKSWFTDQIKKAAVKFTFLSLVALTVAMSVPAVTILVRPDLIPEFRKGTQALFRDLTGFYPEETRSIILASFSRSLPSFFNSVIGRNQTASFIGQDRLNNYYLENLTATSSTVAESIHDKRLLESEKYVLATMIILKSEEAGVDPALGAAVVLHDSYTSTNQKKIIGTINLGNHTELNTLHYKDYRIEPGLKHIASLLDEFGGDIEKALMAKHWNSERLKTALRTKQKIPTAVKNYASEVMAVYRTLAWDLQG